MAPILFLIFVFVVGSFGNAQAASPDCQPKFRKWEVICTEDRTHCYDAKMQPKVRMQTASKPAKRFSAKNDAAKCDYAVLDEGRKEFAATQLGDGTFLEDISFEKWINQNDCCKMIDCKSNPTTSNPPDISNTTTAIPTIPLNSSDFDSLELLTYRGESTSNRQHGWKLKLELNPGLIACDPSEQANGGVFPTKKPKKVKTNGCNEDGSECQEYWVEVFGEQEDDKNPLPIECQYMGESDSKVKSGIYVICYESSLDPNNSFIDPPEFAIQNIPGNAMATFCQKIAKTPEKTWHGIAFKFWVTLSDLDLLVDMQIHFSYTNKIFILPQNKKDHDLALMKYEFMFKMKKTTILDPDGKIHDDYPADLINSREPYQKKAGLWLAFSDMPSDISSIMIFSREDCDKWNGFLDGNLPLKTAKCHLLDDEMNELYRQEEEKRKKADEIMKQIGESIENCHLFKVDPNMPHITLPPELINKTKSIEGQQTGEGGFFSPEQATAILERIRKECGDKNITSRIRKRQIPSNLFRDSGWSDRRWDIKNPIPYVFEKEDIAWKQKIQNGLQLIMEGTCIKFKNIRMQDAKEIGQSYLLFRDIEACSTALWPGRSNGANIIEVTSFEAISQLLHIDIKLCKAPEIAHEVMHRLGFHHEQTRSDRDDFVWINWPEINPNPPANLFQFWSDDEAKNLDTPYDFGSIMHYKGYDAHKNEGGFTIIARERAYQHTMGQRVKPSFKDVKLLNRIYCDDICTKTDLICANGGYPDPLDCTKCRCPDGFDGTKCDRYRTGDDKCQSERRFAKTTAQHIETSPEMNGATYCIWSIKTELLTQRIEIRIVKLDFDCSELCKEESYLEVHMKNDRTSRGARLCCPTAVPSIFMLEPGVDAVITMKRNSDSQQFKLTYVTPDAIEPEKPLESHLICACDRIFNPWHEPGKLNYNKIDDWYHTIRIRSRSNLLINAKRRFYTQNGSVWFERKCVYDDATKIAYGEWIEPVNETAIKINDIVSEECQKNYTSGCAEMNKKWQDFLICVNLAAAFISDNSKRQEIADECSGDGENFQLEACNAVDEDGKPEVVPGIQ